MLGPVPNGARAYAHVAWESAQFGPEIATIPLEGKPEAAVEDVERGLVYVNLEDKGTICVLDVKKHAVAGSHSLSPGEEPTGLALDSKNAILFAGCGNKKLGDGDNPDTNLYWSTTPGLGVWFARKGSGWTRVVHATDGKDTGDADVLELHVYRRTITTPAAWR